LKPFLAMRALGPGETSAERRTVIGVADDRGVRHGQAVAELFEFSHVAVVADQDDGTVCVADQQACVGDLEQRGSVDEDQVVMLFQRIEKLVDTWIAEEVAGGDLFSPRPITSS
jgi:hypothetical protein